ncbi:hypothetical protein D3C81_2288020 [compost metagenome]
MYAIMASPSTGTNGATISAAVCTMVEMMLLTESQKAQRAFWSTTAVGTAITLASLKILFSFA